jgi:hypothetical protein
MTAQLYFILTRMDVSRTIKRKIKIPWIKRLMIKLRQAKNLILE